MIAPMDQVQKQNLVLPVKCSSALSVESQRMKPMLNCQRKDAKESILQAKNDFVHIKCLYGFNNEKWYTSFAHQSIKAERNGDFMLHLSTVAQNVALFCCYRA